MPTTTPYIRSLGKPGVDYSVTREAQKMRRQRLQPENIAEEIRNRHADGDFHGHAKAIDLIKLTAYLDCSEGQRIQLIDQILVSLDEVVGR